MIFASAALRALPWGRIALVAGFLGLVGSGIAWHVHRVDLARKQGTTAGRAEVRSLWDAATIKAQQDAARAEADRRATEHQRQADQRIEVQNAQQATQQARSDADRARLESDRLRVAAKATAARCDRGSGNTGTTTRSEAEPTPGHLLTELSRRLDEAADGIAAHADDARIKGRACEAIHDSLRKKRGR